MLTPVLLALLAGPLLLLLVWRKYSERLEGTYSGFGAPRPPPTVQGVPLLGNALQVGRRGAAFVQECHAKYGDAFTLRLLGQRMTFLFAAPAIERYFTAPDSEITFGPAVQQFTHRIFGLPPKHFFGKHYVMLSALRDQLAPGGLAAYGATLLQLAESELSSWPDSGEVDLFAAIKPLVFKASVSTLFGPALLQSHDPAELQRSFFDFEAGFELAASPVPHALQPRFARARRALLAALRASHEAGRFEGSVAGRLIEACELPRHCIPNMLLALLWASQANSVPATFWSLAFLLLPENQPVRERLLQELSSPPPKGGAAAAGGGAGAGAELARGAAPAAPQQRATELQGKNGAWEARGAHGDGSCESRETHPVLAAARDRQSLLVRCVIEALRLRAMSIDVRIAAADVALPSSKTGEQVLIQKGSVVALSPYTSHQDARLYGSEASSYDPDRTGMLFGGSTLPHAAVVGVGGLAGLSFGGGKYRCPGRYFAELEVGLLLGLLLTKFDFTLRSTTGSAGGGAAAWPAPPSTARGGSMAGGAPGDPGRLLPPPELTKLVGLKVPSGPCWVRFARRRQ